MQPLSVAPGNFARSRNSVFPVFVNRVSTSYRSQGSLNSCAFITRQYLSNHWFPSQLWFLLVVHRLYRIITPPFICFICNTTRKNRQYNLQTGIHYVAVHRRSRWSRLTSRICCKGSLVFLHLEEYSLLPVQLFSSSWLLLESREFYLWLWQKSEIGTKLLMIHIPSRIGCELSVHFWKIRIRLRLDGIIFEEYMQTDKCSWGDIRM